jgi:Putative transposase
VTLDKVQRIFLRVIWQSLQPNSPGSGDLDKAASRIGAVAFIHRFGCSLNEHVHFHVCVVDRVFEEMAGGTDVDTDHQSSLCKVTFYPTSGSDSDALRGGLPASLDECPLAGQRVTYQNVLVWPSLSTGH